MKTRTALTARGSRRKTGWVNGPRPKQEAILRAASGHLKSVPYKVSLRWLFYRLYQDGYYSKNDYDKWEALCSAARNSGWGGWGPDSLKDETRGILHKANGYIDAETATAMLPENLKKSVAWALKIDHFYRQRRYVEIWFEARAMIKQFEYYSKGIDLVPLGGQTSISLKWEIAKQLGEAWETYGKPITVMFFGDADEAGYLIEKEVRATVEKWSKRCGLASGFDCIRCGLTPEQVEFYGVPDNPAAHGYQWEALSDKAAGEIIKTSIDRYIDVEIIDEAEAEAVKLTKKIAPKIMSATRRIISRS